MSTLRMVLDAAIQKKPILNHPFYQRWQRGELTMNELRGYAKEYYAFEREFPRFVSSAHSRCEDPDMRRKLLDNLMHEEAGERNHPEMWLEFAEGLGLMREEVKGHFRSDETEHLLRTFRKHSLSGGITDCLAALYAYESQQPEVARQKIDGLRRHYGVTSESALAFFHAHQDYDVGHSDVEGDMLEQLCETAESRDRAVAVVEDTLAAMYDFLDGVERRYSEAAA